MSLIESVAGELHVFRNPNVAFAQLAQLINDAGARPGARIALSGGKTPAAFYSHVLENALIRPETAAHTDWFTSDERCVPLASPESNFGNAERQFLAPLGVSPERRHPWAVELSPEAAVAKCNEKIITLKKQNGRHDTGFLFNLCILGIGDDAHTASLWPGSPLIGAGGNDFFAATDWPGRGRRLTITEAGLAACERIVVLALGSGKAEALFAAVCGDFYPKKIPAQILRALPERVTWIVDFEATSLLMSPVPGK